MHDKIRSGSFCLQFRSQLNKGEGKENEKTISLDLMKKKNMPLLAQATEDGRLISTTLR